MPTPRQYGISTPLSSYLNSQPPSDKTRIVLKVGEPLPRHKTYECMAQCWKFWDLSYCGGHDYKHGNDAEGQPIFVKHEQESKAGADRRLRIATNRNYCRIVVDKFNSFVFGQSISRDTNEAYTEWAEDVDGMGTSLDEFMRMASLKASVLGKWFIVVDTTKDPNLVEQTAAQAEEAGNRMILSNLHPGRVINWTDDMDQLLVIHDGPGKGLPRLWTNDGYQDISLDDQGKVTKIGPMQSFDWESMPIICVQAMGGCQSLLCDVAELNKAIFNSDSLLREELQKQTFSSWWAAGVSADDLGTVEQGSRKIICINKPAQEVKFERLSADVSQADSLRTTIEMDEREIYRSVGLRMPDTKNGQQSGPESGRALKIRFSETGAIARAIANQACQAECMINDFYMQAYSVPEIEECVYPDQFDEEVMADELKLTLDTLSTPTFPPEMKAEVAVQYMRKALAELPTEVKAVLEAAIRQLHSKPVEVVPPAFGGEMNKPSPEDMAKTKEKMKQEEPEEE